MAEIIKSRIETIKSREKIPIYTKYKKIQVSGATTIKEKEIKDYEFCLCDYCLQTIIINRFEGNKRVKPKWEERSGGIISIPANITGSRDLKFALHNKCLNSTIRELKKG